MGQADTYVQCTICGEYGWANSHKCPPEWVVVFVDLDNDPRTVRASDAQEAVEKAAQDIDSNGDYPIMSNKGSDYSVEVTCPDGTVKHYTVAGEMVPKYRATEEL